MTISKSYRPFLVAAPVHLMAWGALWDLSGRWGLPTVSWDAFLWLFVIGFVGCTILGFLLHLFPALARRPMVPPHDRGVLFVLTEAAVVLGTVGLDGAPWVWIAGSALWMGTVLLFGNHLRLLLRTPAKLSAATTYPTDTRVLPLVLASVAFAALAAGFWLVAAIVPALDAEPGVGLWVTGLHLYLLGQVVLLILGVSLFLVPRALSAPVPLRIFRPVPPLAIAGAILVPLGMLWLPNSAFYLLALLALPEALAATLYAIGLGVLLARARTPKPQATLFLVAALFLLLGGGIGLAMSLTGDFTWIGAHALVNLFGFVGIMVMGMAFSMIAPFQFITHAWTIRAMRLELGVLAAIAGLATVVPLASAGLGGMASELIGALVVLAGGIFWAGSVPVLYYSGTRGAVSPKNH